jgi:3-deoxy-D-manno-octulosonic-acid transferase
MVSFLVNIAYFIGLILYSPVIIYRMIAQKRYRGGWAQRLGKISRKCPDKKCIWIHAVSVGEVNATRTLIDGLKTALPDYEIVISATTDTGLARACALYDKQHSVFYFPFDLSWIMKKAFDNLHPNIILLMELEISGPAAQGSGGRGQWSDKRQKLPEISENPQADCPHVPQGVPRAGSDAGIC